MNGNNNPSMVQLRAPPTPQDLLLWLEVPVYNANGMQVIEGQRQLCQVELNILLRKHDLRDGREGVSGRGKS